MIRVSEPSLTALESAAVQMCLARNQLSMGAEVERFEEHLCEYLNIPYGLTCSSGTTALHLALLAYGIGPGDEVIVPNLTYIATANAVAYCGATVRLAEVRADDWTIDIQSVMDLVNKRTKAIIAVDLYGVLPGNIRELEAVCANKLILIEDAAQAIGASRTLPDGGKFTAGHIGKSATFSFFGNKLMTAGEGGFVTFRHEDPYKRAKKARGQGQDPMRRYWHDTIGYNYRMTEIQAAILDCQLTRLPELMKARRRVWTRYDTYFANMAWVTWQTSGHGVVSPWLKTVMLDEASLASAGAQSAEEIGKRMAKLGVETRPVFYPISQMGVFSERGEYPVSTRISRYGISLPTHPNLTDEDVDTVTRALTSAMGGGVAFR